MGQRPIQANENEVPRRMAAQLRNAALEMQRRSGTASEQVADAAGEHTLGITKVSVYTRLGKSFPTPSAPHPACPDRSH